MSIPRYGQNRSLPRRARARASGVRALALAAFLAACLLGSVGTPQAADLPRATQALLQKLQLDRAVLGDLDKELQLPKEWSDEAAKEGKLIILGTWEPPEFQRLVQPFKERYPAIEFQYSDPVRSERIIKPLVAWQTNRRYLADIVVGIEEGLDPYLENDALEPIGALPSMADVEDSLKDSGGRWVVTKLRFGCPGYNSDKIARAELPASWDDFLTSPALRDGNLALANRPNQWLESLWAVKGEDWGRSFVARLFADLKPQMRHENTNAMANLLAAGEFAMMLPAYDLRILALKARGAHVDLYCPDPAPAFVQITAILKGSPRLHAAKIFMNWLLSKEGQISHFSTSHSVPVDKALQTLPQFRPPGAPAIDSGHVALRGAKGIGKASGIYEAWNRAWENSGNAR